MGTALIIIKALYCDFPFSREVPMLIQRTEDERKRVLGERMADIILPKVTVVFIISALETHHSRILLWSSLKISLNPC